MKLSPKAEWIKGYFSDEVLASEDLFKEYLKHKNNEQVKKDGQEVSCE